MKKKLKYIGKAIFSLFFLNSCSLFSLGPINDPLQHHFIKSLSWSSDGNQLALTKRYEYYEASHTKDFDDSLYLINSDGSNLKKLEDSPLPVTPYSLFQWLSSDTLLTGNIWNVYQVKIDGKREYFLEFNQNKDKIVRVCSIKNSGYILNNVYSDTPLIHITENKQFFPLKIQLSDELKSLKLEFNNDFYSFSCVPNSNKVYLTLVPQNIDSTEIKFYHAIAEIDFQKNIISNLTVFYISKRPTNYKPGDKLETVRFLGWIDKETIFYLSHSNENYPKLELVSHLYEYNATLKNTKELRQINSELKSSLIKEKPFTISPDFKQIVFISEDNKKLMISDFEGKTVKSILDIESTFSEKEQK